MILNDGVFILELGELALPSEAVWSVDSWVQGLALPRDLISTLTPVSATSCPLSPDV